MLSVRYFSHDRYHGKGQTSGSTFIRMKQLEKYWTNFESYKYGEHPDVLIFQKVYNTPDYRFPEHYPGIKILDICDPDWLDDVGIVDTCRFMDAVTVPTQALKEFISQFHKNVVVIPDRFDVEILPKPKQHTQPAKTVAWFGYGHNSELLRPAMHVLEELHLNLILISNDDPIPDRWGSRKREEFYTFVKYNEDNFYEELQKADMAVLPDGNRPVDIFKSNNKTIKANLAGLPVAKTADEVKQYMDAKERQLWFDNNYGLIKEQYDIRESVKEYKDIISRIQEIRENGNL